MSEIINPQDAELEEIILGSCLIESKAITLIADILRPEAFYNEKNLEIYATLQSMYRNGQKIDIITVKEELARRGKLEFIGGPYTLAHISGRVASSAHLEYHARILKQKYIRRETILGFHKLLALAADETTDIDDTLADAHTLLDRLENECGTTEHLRSMLQLMDDTIKQIEARISSNKNGITGLPTGFSDLDRLTCGWQPGDEVVIAARPAVGKTSFALHLARAAASAGYHIAIFSLEMLGERLGDRWLLAATTNVNPDNDNPSVSMDYVRSSAKLLQSKGECDGVIIDYLQLCDMKSDRNNRNREQEVAQASRKAKMLAKELNIPVILLSQLNRNVEGRPDSRPSLSDLRESGAIEQDADLVLMLSRPALSGRDTDRKSTYPTEGLGVIDIVKHRNGTTKELYFRHDPSMTKLEDYVPGIAWMKKNTTA